MTPKLLTEYEDIKCEIHEMERDIKASENLYEKVMASMDTYPYIELEIPLELHTSERTLALQKHLLEDLKAKRHSVEQFMQSIESSRIRRIIRLHYIKGLSWQQVANRIGGNATADGLRVQVDRFWKKTS